MWCILGKAFILLPLGTVAWRVNLVSAALGALAVGTLALLVFRFTMSFRISLVTGLLFATSRDFWSQAVVAEVYTLNVLLFLLPLLFVVRFEDAYRTRWLYLAAFTLGLGLTNHSTLGPLIPVFLGWTFLRHPVLLRNPVLCLNLAAAFLLGFSIVLYLPMRSAADPVMDWGNPETISATVDHVLRRQYTSEAGVRPRTFLGQAELMLLFLGTFAAQFTPFVAAFAGLGALENRREERSSFRLLLLLFGLTSYGFMWLLNYPADRENLHLTRVFFLPANAIGCIWIGLALKRLAVRGGALLQGMPKTRLHGAWILGGVLVALPLLSNFRQNNESQNHLAEDWGRNILESLKPDAIILPSSDHSTFPLIYLQAVEGLRQDVIIADKYGYVDDAVFRRLFDGRVVPRVAPPLSGSPAEKERYLVEHSGRPVYFTTKSRLVDLETHDLRTWGLVFEAVRKGTNLEESEHTKLWASFRFREGSLNGEPGDFGQDLILADYHYARARHEILFKHESEALISLARAERHAFGIKEVHNNLGGALAEAGRPELALGYFQRALAVDLGYELAAANYANALFALKRYRQGLPWFERMLKSGGESMVALLGKARAHKERGEEFEAYSAYSRAYRKDPGNGALRGEVEEYARKVFGEKSSLAKLDPGHGPRARAGWEDEEGPSNVEGMRATAPDPRGFGKPDGTTWPETSEGAPPGWSMDPPRPNVP